MDNLTGPLSREISSAAGAVGEVVKKGSGHHHWGHHGWGHHAGRCGHCPMLAAGVFIGIPAFGGYLGTVYAAAKDKEDPWLRTLKMPSWTLPEPMFQPMWNASYLTMGYASYMVWKCGGGFHGKAQLPLLLYGGQLALSLAWIPLCYGAKSIKMAAITSVGTEALAIAATVTFYSVCPKAAYLMIPYLAWLTYETSLSLAMVCLNKDKNQE